MSVAISIGVVLGALAGFAVFTAVWFARLLPQLGAGPAWPWLNWLWCAGILWSTVATRQHVALDVLAGSALGLVVAVVHLSWLGAGTTQRNSCSRRDSSTSWMA